MKKTISFVCFILCFLVVCASCDIDPYEGKRPLDYEGSVWIFQSNEYVICYNVADNTQSYYQKGEGEKNRFHFCGVHWITA
jgi:hypothetical protein